MLKNSSGIRYVVGRWESPRTITGASSFPGGSLGSKIWRQRETTKELTSPKRPGETCMASSERCLRLRSVDPPWEACDIPQPLQEAKKTVDCATHPHDLFCV
jgi:hypothetical protein